MKNDQLLKHWYKALIVSIVNLSAKVLTLLPTKSVEANLQAIQFVLSSPSLPFTTSPSLSKPISSMSTTEQCICYKCKQKGHLISSCSNKTNKKLSGLFALSIKNNGNNDPSNNTNNDEDDPHLITINFGPSLSSLAILTSLECNDVDSYYKYYYAINELVQDLLNYDFYG
ncbi:hypothetical protein QOT17_025478 [Balamuthia mandrillaris]